MKYIIIGFHGSGKQEIIDDLNSLGVKCGKLFSNIEQPSPDNYMSNHYELFTTEEINSVFDNNAYIFFKEMEGYGYKYYEGLSKYEFENNDVFIMSPHQYSSIPPTTIKEEITIIWLDNLRIDRFNRYTDENRVYNFNIREMIEKKNISYFIQNIYNEPNILYFNDEIPTRVSSIIYSMVTYPELIPIYLKNFN